MKTFHFSLGDGRSARGVIVEDRGKLVEVAHPESATRMTCSRRAFLDNVWRVDGTASIDTIPSPSDDGVFTPAGFERAVLARSCGVRFPRFLHVVDGVPGAPYADGERSVRLRGQEHRIAPAVRVLDVGDADALPQFGAIRELRALRLVRVHSRIDLDTVAALRPQMLSLEHVEVDSLARLRAWTWIEQLELRGFWQYNVADVEWLFELPKLQRLTLDLGGRRKNVEMYKRLRTAYAWPFDLIARAEVIADR